VNKVSFILPFSSFEHGLRAIRLDKDSGLIWNQYLDFLESKQDQDWLVKADEVYWRLLESPVSNTSDYISR
jgi:hypothetical protein